MSMYTPSSFKEENPEVLFKLIEKHNFGILFSQHGNAPEATHLPFLVDKTRGVHGTLIAHFARANKHWKNLAESKEVLAVFQGPHTYITPSWYKNRDTVPTWNYATVHVYGKPKVIHELVELREMVTRLTYFHEGQLDSDWALEESGKHFEIDLKAITGLEIEITRMEGKFKFNQNKKEEDQRGVIENLEKLGEKEVSSIMKENLKREY